MSIAYETTTKKSKGDIYATIKTDLNSVTFQANNSDYRKKHKRYLKDLLEEYVKIKKCYDFKNNFLKSNTNNVEMLKVAETYRLKVFVHYKDMTNLEVIKITDKTVKVKDNCGNEKFIRHKFFNEIKKECFAYSVA